MTETSRRRPAPFLQVDAALLRRAGARATPLSAAAPALLGRARPVASTMAPALSLSVRDPHVDLRIDGDDAGVAGLLETFGAYVGPGATDPSCVFLPFRDTASAPENDPARAVSSHGGVHLRLSVARAAAARPWALLLHARGPSPAVLEAHCGDVFAGTLGLHDDGPLLLVLDAAGVAWDADFYFLADGPPGARWRVAGIELHRL